MTEIKLSPRLLLVASFVERGAAVCDVGTDHGYLAIYLAAMGMASRVLGCDIRRGPLNVARANIERLLPSGNITLHHGDGTAPVDHSDADTVIIAGMGGEVIAGIIERSRLCKKENVRLILQPMSRHECLRRFLSANGYAINREGLCREGRRLYLVLSAQRGREKNVGPLWDYTGNLLYEQPHPLAASYLKSVLSRLKKEREGMLLCRSDRDLKRLEEAELLIEGIEAMLIELTSKLRGRRAHGKTE